MRKTPPPRLATILTFIILPEGPFSAGRISCSPLIFRPMPRRALSTSFTVYALF